SDLTRLRITSRTQLNQYGTPPRHRAVLRRSLDAQHLLSDVLPAPLRRTPHVHADSWLGALLPPVHVPDPRFVVLESPRLRHPTPHAPRLLGHREGPALTGDVQQPADDDEPHQGHLSRYQRWH